MSDLTRVTEPVRLSLGDVLRLGFLGISTRKLRAVLSALGISLGIATMIIVTGIPASSQAALLDRLTALGTNILRADPVPQQGDPLKLPEDAQGMAARIGPVTAAAVVGNTHMTVRRSDLVDPLDSGGLTVLAGSLDLPSVINAHVYSGSFLTTAGSHFPTVVLGSVAASRLGFSRIVPGQPAPEVYIGDTWFTVVGILAPMPLAQDIERSVIVGWDAAKTTLGFDGHPTVVYVKAQEDSIESVRAVLPAALYPQSPGLVQVSLPSEALAAKRATESSFSGLFLGLAGVALLVGGVGIANTMFISVLERRGEIGLRRALGATRGQIRGQFLAEAVALSGLGGAAGIVLGILITVGYAAFQGWPPVIPTTAVVLGIVGALVVGMVAGLNPSIRAARLTPTEALASV
ncbi:MAG TPA: ABC transporter permease [Lacisediminihabitans sp.]|uniref:ABC transporter permease n=1 Tax=Lacisediminihabitans sp. TaxID=2787631 RepID=UPI002ED8833F